MKFPLKMDWLRLMRRVDLSFLAMNLLGAVAYDTMASYSWRIPEEHGMVPITGEPFVWFAGIFPIVIGFLLLNLTWTILILCQRRRQSSLFWTSTVALWVTAVVIDFAHH